MSTKTSTADDPRSKEIGKSSPLFTDLGIEQFEVKKGYVDVPKGLGLGIELNEKTFQKYSFE